MLKRVSLQFFSVLTVVFFLVGTIGVSRYQHHCKVNGSSYSWFLPTDHACQSSKEQKENKACCSSKKNNSELQISASSCCTSGFIFFQIGTDLTTNNSCFDSENTHFPLVLAENVQRVDHQKNKCCHYREPPPLKSNLRLAYLQVYQI